MHPKITIHVVNPVPGGARVLGYAHALRYVKQGRAQWVGSNAIRFLSAHHSHQRAVESALGYDRDQRIRTRHELKHVPFTGDVERLYIVRRRAA